MLKVEMSKLIAATTVASAYAVSQMVSTHSEHLHFLLAAAKAALPTFRRRVGGFVLRGGHVFWHKDGDAHGRYVMKQIADAPHCTDVCWSRVIWSEQSCLPGIQ